jgi:hypothetical protein
MPDRTTPDPKFRPLDDDTTPTAKASKTKPNSSGSTTRTGRKSANDKLRDRLAEFYAGIGGIISTAAMFRGDPNLVAAGTNIGVKSEELADLWLELADTNPKVKQFLESFVEGSSLAGIIIAHVGIILPFLSAQQVIPVQLGEMFLADEAKAARLAFAASMNFSEAGN